MDSIVITGGAALKGTIRIAGAKNAALFAAALLSSDVPAVREALLAFRAKQTADVLAISLD